MKRTVISHTVCYGHVVGDDHGQCGLPTDLPVKDVFKMRLGQVLSHTRKPMMATNGMHIAGAAPICTDLNAPENFAAAACKRIASETIVPDKATMLRFKKFVAEWLSKNLEPLCPTTDVSFETWIENTNYSRGRKDDLTKLWEEHTQTHLDPEVTVVKAFLKEETYSTWKYSRTIMARSDLFKCFLGPYIKAIETEVYKLPYFIKHVPEPLRPEYIMNLLHEDGASYSVTDHTSFEAAFVPEIMEAAEFQLYSYMTSQLEGGNTELREMCGVLKSVNIIQSKLGSMRTTGRMSGEMCTSLGNGFANLMCMLFTCEEKGAIDLKGVVEGDDGLFKFRGVSPEVSDFAKIGFRVKLDVYDNLSDASFCGMIFDPTDKIVVTDGIEVACKLGWCGKQYVMASQRTRETLLRSKALSYNHQYCNCPIIGALSRAAIRCTEHLHPNAVRRLRHKEKINLYERELLMLQEKCEVKRIDIPYTTRLLYDEHYGVSPADQVALEAYFDGINQIQALDHSLLLKYVVPEYRDFFSQYVVVDCPHEFGSPPIPDERGLKDIEHVLKNAVFDPSIT